MNAAVRPDKGVGKIRKILTILFISATLIAFIGTSEYKHAPVPSTIYVLCAALLLYTYLEGSSVFADQTVSLLPLALAIEYALFVWLRSDVATQVLITVVISAALLGSKICLHESNKQRDQNTNLNLAAKVFFIENNMYIYAWLCARIIVIISRASNSSVTFWYVSQTLLITAIFVSISLKGEKLRQSVYLTTSLLILSTAFYVSKQVVPYGLLLFLLILPFAFVIDKTFNAHYAVKGHSPNHNSFFEATLKVTVVVCFIFAASIWQAYLRKTEHNKPEDQSSLELLNKKKSFVGCSVFDARDDTCCYNGYMLFPRNDVKGCVHVACFSKINNGQTDCCNNVLTDDNVASMSGPYLCLHGASPNLLYL